MTEERPWVCEWPVKPPCSESVVAVVGLPYKNAIQVCGRHFRQWEDEGKQELEKLKKERVAHGERPKQRTD